MKLKKTHVYPLLVSFFIFISCSDNENEEPLVIGTYTGIVQNDLKQFLPDVNFIAYKKDFQDNHANHYVLGVRNSHLWFRMYQSDSLAYIPLWQNVFEWEDTDIINTKVDSTYLGYGNYEISPAITGINLVDAAKNGNSFFAYYGIYPPKKDKNGQSIYSSYCLFVSNGTKKICQYDHQGARPELSKWFNGSIIIDNCCYSEKGDTLYTLNYIASSVIPVSYEDGVKIENGYITRHDFRRDKTIWSTKILSPYNEPSNSRYTYTLLSQSINMLKYKVNILYYDGTKKEFVFTVNLDDGKITIINNN